MKDNWYVSDGSPSFYDFDKDVIDWNKKRGFLDKPFDLEKDTGYLVSEVLEALDWDAIKSMLLLSFAMLDVDEEVGEIEGDLMDVKNHDDFARWMCKYFIRQDYDDIDYCDMITDLEVFGVGGRAKIGLNTDNISDIRKAVMDKNYAKKAGDIDEHGKQRKGIDFVPPEKVIKEILGRVKR